MPSAKPTSNCKMQHSGSGLSRAMSRGTKCCILVLLMLLFPLWAIAAPAGIIAPVLLKNIERDAVGLKVIHDGDQAILLAGKSLILFDNKDGRELSRHEFGVSENPLRLDLVSPSEIAVTSVSAGSLSSYIFEAANNEFRVALKEAPYFFRVVEMGGRPILAGQASSSVLPFAGGIWEFVWDGAKLRKVGRINLPKRIGIYQFAPSAGDDWEKIWVRDDSGYLKRYEKRGRKWKITYKTSERYRGGVNCFLFKKDETISEERPEPVCVPTPPVVLRSRVMSDERRATGDELIIVDSHDFLLGGVLLEPAKPRKAYINLLAFKESEGLRSCKRWGPYQGWIGGYFLDSRWQIADGKNKSAGVTKLIMLRNTTDKYAAKVRVEEIDISNVDCGEEF